jgi:sulfur relay (sulfurtransferase) complex TusBCD TusD component (DsrE family)
MDKTTVILFTRNGMGDGPADLQQALVRKFLSLNLEHELLPAKILFYTDGVMLACQGSTVIDLLKQYEEKGVELVLCSTCLERYGLNDQVEAGIVGGMGDIIDALSKAPKVLSL